MKINIAIGILVNDKNQVFLAKRPEDKTYGGYWEFPGGKVEFGETLLEALNREFKEELAMETENEVWTLFNEIDKSSYSLYFFIAKTETAYYPQALENQQDFGWKTMKEINSLRFPETNFVVIKQLQRLLIKNR